MGNDSWQIKVMELKMVGLETSLHLQSLILFQ